MLCWTTQVFGQEITGSPLDTLPKDTIPIPINKPSKPSQSSADLPFPVSPDSPDEEVLYDAQDSMDYAIRDKIVFLYGDAVVTQNTMTLTAERITIDFGNNIIIAEGVEDSLGNRTGDPVFEDGEQNFTVGKMRYNFQTKKGKIYGSRVQEGDLYIVGSEAKIIQDVKNSKGSTDNIAYNRSAIFTTCNHSTPHFGIRAKKLKMIPNKVAVIGPANIELGGVPTPLALPFGFFPLKQGARTGLIFPRDYEFSDEWGFGLRNVGWYFPISDHWDTKVLTDLYFKGTWGVSIDTRYKYRYRNSGNFNLAFSDRIREQADASIGRERSLSLRWSHSQDRSAHPTRTFSASVNIQTNGFQSRNFNDASSVLTNSLSSNVNYTKTFPESPFNLTASMNHSQNTRTNVVTFNLPTVGLRMKQIFPFKKKQRVGEEKWYEKVGFRYDMDVQNRLSTTDTTLFSNETLESAQYGMRHRMSSDVNLKLFKYINVSPNINYSEVWYGDEIERLFIADTTIVADTLFNPDGSIFEINFDTTGFGEVEEFKRNRFSRYFQMSAGVNLNTTRFFTKQFEKGFIRGVRHVAKPTIGFSFTPDYTAENLGFFKNVITPESSLNEIADTTRYSVFTNGIYGGPSSGGRQMLITYGLRNNFEAKYWSKRDSTAKKVKLFNDINIRGDYNLAKDSLRWSDIRAGGNTRFFKGITNVAVNARWSPYALNENFNTINTFYWETNRRPLRFVEATLRTSTNFTVQQLIDVFTGNKSSGRTINNPLGNTGSVGMSANDDLPSGITGPSELRSRADAAPRQETFFDLFSSFRLSYNLNLSFESSRQTGNDTLVVSSHAVETRGNFNLTENWRVTVGRVGYDFKNKRVTFPDFSFYRDLHCWEMGMSWRPERTVYSFFLRVKPSSLDFIEVPYRKNNADGRFGGF
ncbi:MAG: putative LPS assembly protein LptD [Bacteroidota bacterium]